ncbi:uncharacterized protein [Maniola hyperantus]|uniref:uncharacterized protein n=1 Tax=Aphantopus hyperantus TaxID=2795564 RepID=UPI0021462DB6
MLESFTNVLWYLEFFAFAILLIVFFCFILYIAKINYVSYNKRYDFQQNLQEILITKPKPKLKPKEPNQRPVCFDVGCVWFCRLIGSIIIITVCYCGAYTFISDTKLRFGLFVP